MGAPRYKEGLRNGSLDKQANNAVLDFEWCVYGLRGRWLRATSHLVWTVVRFHPHVLFLEFAHDCSQNHYRHTHHRDEENSLD